MFLQFARLNEHGNKLQIFANYVRNVNDKGFAFLNIVHLGK